MLMNVIAHPELSAHLFQARDWGPSWLVVGRLRSDLGVLGVSSVSSVGETHKRFPEGGGTGTTH